ncbi:MAG: hypothetical protein ACRC8F_04100 [Cetobacterium sp.]
MALTQKQQEILEEYLRIKCVSRVQAIKNLYPAMKRPDNYATKIFNNPEFRDELHRRRGELLNESMTDLTIIVKALNKNLLGSLGVVKRTVLAHGKNGFDKIEGMFQDSREVKDYYGVLKDILGPQISLTDARKEILEDKELDLKHKKHNLEAEKVAIERHKATKDSKIPQVVIMGEDRIED